MLNRTPLDIESDHLGVGDLDSLGIGPCIDLAEDLPAGLGRCGGDQFDHRQTAGQPAILILAFDCLICGFRL